jgi:hypothetical protein
MLFFVRQADAYQANKAFSKIIKLRQHEEETQPQPQRQRHRECERFHPIGEYVVRVSGDAESI